VATSVHALQSCRKSKVVERRARFCLAHVSQSIRPEHSPGTAQGRTPISSPAILLPPTANLLAGLIIGEHPKEKSSTDLQFLPRLFLLRC